VALGAIVVIGAALRFSTLGLQSYRYDEAVTVGRVLQPNLFHTLSTVPSSESTPPLYYLLAWFWSRLFGSGEVGLRSLSALAGTASIPAVYLGAIALPLPRRAGLIAAMMVAVSPVLIWFSQDARAYALVFFLSALSFLFFARARRSGSRRDLLCWALFSALAICTHYFAGFVVAPEAALLIIGSAEPRRGAVAIAAVVVVAALLLPLALRQANNAHAGWIAKQPLSGRLERAGAKLVGDDNGDEHGVRQPGPIPLGVPVAIAIAGLALLLWRGDQAERRGAGLAAAVGLSALALPIVVGALGADYFDGRNLIPVFVPLIVLGAAGFGVRRGAGAGLALAGAFCLCSLIFAIEIDRLPRLQRENLRNAASQVGALHPGLAVVTIKFSGNEPLRYYLGASYAHGAALRLGEIDLVGSGRAAETNAPRLLGPAFHIVVSKPVSYNFTLTSLRSRRPVRVPLAVLEQAALVGGGRYASVLVGQPR
jgi:mannosyltransferase